MDASEELRLFLRRKVSESLYSFCKIVLGFKDLTPTLHGEVCRYVQDSFRQHKLIVLPRGHLKTSICTIGYALWRAVKDPNIRILISNATATNASHFLRNIGAIVETNSLLRWLFPEVIPDIRKVKWTENEIEFKRTKHWPESTIEAIGVGGTVVSRHYDLLIEDDLIAPEDGFVTPELIAKTTDWHRYATSLFVSPKDGEQLVVGTRWLMDDFIQYLIDNEKWFLPHLHKSVYVDSAKQQPLWPERFTPEVIDRILEQQGPRIFSCQYMNDPVHEDARSFDSSWFRYLEALPPVPIKYYTAVDPALATKRGDYTAIVTIGMDPDFSIYIVDARKGRWGVDEMIDNIFEVHRTWKPAAVGLETVMFQKALMWPLREAMRRERYTFRVDELRPSSQVTKEARISALHEYFANGSIWLRKGLHDLEKELRGWPAITHDDVLDALAYAVQMARPAFKTQKVNENPLQIENILRELKSKHGMNTDFWTWHKRVPVYQPRWSKT